MHHTTCQPKPHLLTNTATVQVYKAILRDTGEEVAVKVQRPGVEPVILRDLFIFRKIAGSINNLARQRLGCNAELIVDEFGEKLLEELDYQQEARNISVSLSFAISCLGCIQTSKFWQHLGEMLMEASSSQPRGTALQAAAQSCHCLIVCGFPSVAELC